MSTFYIKKNDDDLIHYGVLGMRWGVRRYQNKDGSLTSAGKRKYYKDYVKRVKNQEDSYNYIKQTISKKDVEQLAMKRQKFKNSINEYEEAVKKYFPEASELRPINKEELIDAIMMLDKKYRDQYNEIAHEAHQNAINGAREFFTKEENLKMSDEDIQKTRYYNKYFSSFMYDDNKKLNDLKKKVKLDPRLNNLANINKNQTKLLNEIEKEESKIVDDLIGDIGKEVLGDENWRNRFNIGFNISNYVTELLDDEKYTKYINNRINKGE